MKSGAIRRSARALPLLAVALASSGCEDVERAILAFRNDSAPATKPHAAPSASVRPLPVHPTDAGPAPGMEIYADGGVAGHVDAPFPAQSELTELDLGDDFSPYPLTDGDGVPQPYRSTFLALADERVQDDEWREGGEAANRFLELYGIFPTLRVVRQRLEDSERHACHAAAGAEFLTATPAIPLPFEDVGRQRAKLKRVKPFLAGAPVAQADGKQKPLPKELEAAVRQVQLVKSVQGHLKCDGLLRKGTEDGIWDDRAADALRLWQRQHMIIAWGGLSPETRAAMVEDDRELIFRDALRVLRERVMDAAGIIEDGSAVGKYGTVLGRVLDPVELRTPARREPLANGASDLLSPATEAAARALGWTSPDGLLAWLRLHPKTAGHLPVAVKLPPLPAYYAAEMDLRAEVDRGDVFYDCPYDSHGKAVPQGESARPIVTLLARTKDGDIPLIRWNSTIGGWKRERLEDGEIGMKYKESEFGDFAWRDVIAAPAWIPPETTPEKEIARRTSHGWAINGDEFGPGYRSAYGLVMFINYVVTPSGKIAGDHGIRVHGSVNYRSILGGQSHGCHRLFNHLALRLATFVLEHRKHVRKGNVVANYQRDVTIDEQKLELKIPTRGYRFELTPPVPVRVLEGNIRGEARAKIEDPMRLPEDLRKSAEDAGESLEGPGVWDDAGPLRLRVRRKDAGADAAP